MSTGLVGMILPVPHPSHSIPHQAFPQVLIFIEGRQLPVLKPSLPMKFPSWPTCPWGTSPVLERVGGLRTPTPVPTTILPEIIWVTSRKLLFLLTRTLAP